MIDINKFIDFLCKNQLTPNQFTFCYLLCTDDVVKRTSNEIAFSNKGNIYKYFNEIGAIVSIQDIRYLEDRGFIVDTNKKGDTYYDNFVVTQTLIDLLFGKEEDFEDLWKLYPAFIKIDGRSIPAKSCNPDELSKKYFIILRKTSFTHSDVIETLKYCKENDLISMGIEKWVMSRQWENFKEKPKKDDGFAL